MVLSVTCYLEFTCYSFKSNNLTPYKFVIDSSPMTWITLVHYIWSSFQCQINLHMNCLLVYHVMVCMLDKMRGTLYAIMPSSRWTRPLHGFHHVASPASYELGGDTWKALCESSWVFHLFTLLFYFGFIIGRDLTVLGWLLGGYYWHGFFDVER